MKPLFIVSRPGIEIWEAGGFLAKFRDDLIVKKDLEDKEIKPRDRARVVYVTMADYQQPNGHYISLDTQRDIIRKQSELLGFTTEVVYWGRKYQDNLRKYTNELKEKLQNRIAFYRPTSIFMETGYGSDVNTINELVKDLVCYNMPSVNLFGFTSAGLNGVFSAYGNKQQIFKEKAIRNYEFLQDRRGNQTIIRENDNYRGKMINKKYAEVFKVIKSSITFNL